MFLLFEELSILLRDCATRQANLLQPEYASDFNLGNYNGRIRFYFSSLDNSNTILTIIAIAILATLTSQGAQHISLLQYCS